MNRAVKILFEEDLVVFNFVKIFGYIINFPNFPYFTWNLSTFSHEIVRGRSLQVFLCKLQMKKKDVEI